MADYYKILGLSPDADESEIRAAYRRLAKKYHPDAGEGSSADRFRDIQDAYELLSDLEKRKEYDRSRVAGSSRTFVPRYSAPTVHMDLREIMHSSKQSYAEPVEFRRARMSIDEDWEELLRYFFRDFD